MEILGIVIVVVITAAIIVGATIFQAKRQSKNPKIKEIKSKLNPTISGKEKSRIFKYYTKFFDGNVSIMQETSVQEGDQHVDLVHFSASEKFPFQVLATIGASSYKMPHMVNNMAMWNEYVMFFDKDFNLNDERNGWAIQFLAFTAKFAYRSQTTLTYYHTLETQDDEGEEKPEEDEMLKHTNMRAVYLMSPKILNDFGVKIGAFKNIFFLQAMPITGQELAKAKEMSEKDEMDFLEKEFYNFEKDPTGFLVKAER